MRAVVILTLAFIIGCTGIQVRNNLLMPVAADVYPHIALQVEIGIEAGLLNEEMSLEAAEVIREQSQLLMDILKARERHRLLEVNWALLEKWATMGVHEMINRGEVSPSVGAILYSRIVHFRETLAKLLQ